jgi:hypothetical protein
MKCLKVLILFFSFSILFEMTTTSVNAADCTITDGEFSETEIKSDCATLPARYEIIVYEAYLCTSAATLPTTVVADLSMCAKVFENTAGAVASVVQDKDIDLVGVRIRPPNGTYTHAYAKINKTFGITWSGKIDGDMTGAGGNGTGPFCATLAGAGTFENGSIHTNSTICGAEEIVPGKFIETMNSFSDSQYDSLSGLITDVPGNPGATIQATIVTAAGIASTSNSEALRFEAAMKNAVPIIINEDTRGLTVKFSLVNAMDLKEENSNDRIEVSSGPFISIMGAQ